MPSSLALWDDLNGFHGRRGCIQEQVLCGLLCLALGPWGGPPPRRTLVMSFVPFFTCLPAGPDFSFVSHHATNGYWPLLFPLAASGHDSASLGVTCKLIPFWSPSRKLTASWD